jgi:phosphopantetheinyl transferase
MPAGELFLYVVDLSECGSALESTEMVARAGVGLAEAAAWRRAVHHQFFRACLLESGLCRDPPALAHTRAGKPYVPGGPHVSLSRSERFGLVGLCAGSPIGVDIEAIRAVSVAPERAESLRAVAAMLDPDDAGAREPQPFLQAWVRLEALGKCRGVPLSALLESAESGALLPGNMRDRIAPGQVDLIEFDLAGCYLAAAAIEGACGRVARAEFLDAKSIRALLARWGMA